MKPVSEIHARLQAKLVDMLNQHLTQGYSFSDFTVKRAEESEVVDVVWISEDRLQQVEAEFVRPEAPEVCVEVISPQETIDQKMDKKKWLFEAAALEVWWCDEEGNMAFFHHKRKLWKSQWIPDFPHKIELE